MKKLAVYFPQLFSESILLPFVSGVDAPAGHINCSPFRRVKRVTLARAADTMPRARYKYYMHIGKISFHIGTHHRFASRTHVNATDWCRHSV